ncbi:rhodanese-like domain-containing protein [Kamptonema cortianum]|uniref:Rhodanese-like domain-containing protein n=1 Tax=Geitlerinema calcuttense NRMC-F 0142 TaxID=2922238 RepID=A0ABT7LZ18_9CYAN|nr:MULTISPECIES: rhodanese-like domain-containing protein [Cyanophyceae]MDK3156670.1 rhodanese-like domain-containing protein [Kamptonema cortianum]MDL5050321.1 rhodanese-like domain-containing protein [Oscillatoria amoena NRMC-F 0135]MDL5053407.1 rhodanese-like domain-containing protein [Oscillatoria laete-virens NRMC-F 0139]MDL5056625.1 rhodanese-like domain-containing protein [Geitlerinema calcuttense NRMC-F 0142]
MSSVKSMSVGELKSLLDSQSPIRLIDVREEDEYALARIPGAELIPLSAFAKRALQELKPDEKIVIHCHHGGRSMQACLWLSKQGYNDLTNVAGGIEQWAMEIDPKVPRY